MKWKSTRHEGNRVLDWDGNTHVVTYEKSQGCRYTARHTTQLGLDNVYVQVSSWRGDYWLPSCIEAPALRGLGLLLKLVPALQDIQAPKAWPEDLPMEPTSEYLRRILRLGEFTLQ
jgi:hypothetical protein